LVEPNRSAENGPGETFIFRVPRNFAGLYRHRETHESRAAVPGLEHPDLITLTFREQLLHALELRLQGRRGLTPSRLDGAKLGFKLRDELLRVETTLGVLALGWHDELLRVG
jgi:hypothetical protein